MYKNKLLQWLFAAAFMNIGIVEDTGGGGGADTGGGFDVEAASDSIGADLFGARDDDDNQNPDPAPASVDGGDKTDPATQSPDPSKQTPIAPPAGQEQQPDPAAQKPAAPRTWRPEAAAAWDALPPTVQQEVIKREEDMFKGIEGYKAHATVGQTFQQATQVFAPLLTQQGHDPIQLTHQLLSAHATLSLGSAEDKLAAIQQIAQSYGVELNPVDPENAPYVDPQVAALQKQLAAVQSKLSQNDQLQAQQRAQQETEIRATLSAEIEKFASDPANPYFDEVANDIVALMNAGLAKDLKDAYEQAVYRNPVTRAKEIERKASETAQAAQKAAAEKAAKARAATSVNVRTSPKQASGTAALGSMDDTLAATLAAMKARDK
jgi:hypothetical protein